VCPSDPARRPSLAWPASSSYLESISWNISGLTQLHRVWVL
jgi:hypothetical protein